MAQDTSTRADGEVARTDVMLNARRTSAESIEKHIQDLVRLAFLAPRRESKARVRAFSACNSVSRLYEQAAVGGLATADDGHKVL